MECLILPINYRQFMEENIVQCLVEWLFVKTKIQKDTNMWINSCTVWFYEIQQESFTISKG
jgi:hypothetical protein